MEFTIKDNNSPTTIELPADAAAMVISGEAGVEIYLPHGDPAPLTATVVSMLGFLLDESNNDLGFILKRRFEDRIVALKKEKTDDTADPSP